jgi:urea transport system permease protein
MLCGLAGALYVPQVGIINPSEMQPSSSVEIAIWVAVGGRGTLAGPVLGALLVNGAKSWLTVAFPTAWLFVLGSLFVVVTLAVPGGVVELFAKAAMLRPHLARAPAAARRALRARGARREEPPAPPPAAVVAAEEPRP